MESQQGGVWYAQEMQYHINVLEFLAIKLVLQIFLKTLKHKAIISRRATNISVNFRGYPEFQLVQLAKEIMDHFIQCRINLIAE